MRLLPKNSHILEVKSLKQRKKPMVLIFIFLFGIFATVNVLPVTAAGGTIVYGTTDSMMSLDPAHGYDFMSSTMMMAFTHGLMEMPLDSTDPEKGPIVESYSISSDAKEYTFVLKQGIKFADGTPFNASALQWQLNRVMTLEGDCAFLLTDVVNKTEVIGDYTVKFTLNKADATFLARLCYPVGWPVSTLSLSETEIGGDPESIPIGLGPYTIDSWTKDTELILVPNPNYFGDPPKNDRIIIKFYSDASSMLTALETGDLDVAHRIFGPEEMTTIMEDDSLDYATKDTAGIRYLVFNVFNHPDVRVRQAIAAAVNRTELVGTVYNNLNKELFSMVPDIFTSHVDAFEEGPIASHVDGNMTAAGYNTDTNKYVLDLWYTPTHYGDTEKDVAQIIKRQLEDTEYFTVTLKSSEWTTYVGDFIAQTMPFYLLGWWFDYADHSNYISPFVGETRYSNYSSSVMDGYVDTIITDTDADNRKTAAINAQKLFAEDVPLIPLFTMLSQFIAFQKDIKGVQLEPSENFHFFTIEKEAGAIPGFELIPAMVAIFITGTIVWQLKKKKV
jgi:peptide/nickel transport system substrate-binding protein